MTKEIASVARFCSGWSFALLAFILLVTLTPASAAQAEPLSAILEFRNNTDATIRIELVSSIDDFELKPMVVRRNAVARIPFPVGNHTLDLVAYKASPQHIHRIALSFEPGQSTHYTFSAGKIGRYLFYDADALSALPTVSVAPVKPADSAPHFREDQICKPALNDFWGVVIWDPRGEQTPTYYRRRAHHLCALDGRSFYRVGPVHERYNCVSHWRDCARDEGGDAVIEPPVKTSEIEDTARKLAASDRSHSGFVQTWRFAWNVPGRPAWRFSKYIVDGTLEQRETTCPEGYRLHYQGFCINIEDEQNDDPNTSVRAVELAGSKD